MGNDNVTIKLEHRVKTSADLSDYVYKYERAYTDALNNGDDIKEASESTKKELNQLIDRTDLTYSDGMYDKETGIAAIAVKDKNTGETYIAYAGTNKDADGATDFISDANIGANNSAYLKRLGDKATSFYDRVQSNGDNIIVTTGHSYGDFLASRVAIELIPFFINFRKVNDSFHFCY
ncbi:TPA: hypothetical protein ACIZ9X_001258 [Streptococcus agalactiae]